jgi:hypothetical protein
MASTLGGWLRVFVAGAGLLGAGAGCSESFTATGGGGSTSTGGGGTGGAGASSTGGGGTTTSTVECTQGETQPCYTGAKGTKGTGICHAGVNKCVSGKWSGTCYGQVTPEATETCDGADNNCNGTTDEGCSCTDGAMQDCTAGSGTPGVGICKTGTQTCSGGAWGACTGAVGAGDETCQNMGADDDCNGTKDDVPNAGTACDTGNKGVCSAGMRHCVGDASPDLTCVQSTQPTAETCGNQGADNNCDGTLDNVPNVGGSCNLPLQMGGTCTGTLKCGNGGAQPACAPTVYFAEDFANPQGWQTDNEWALGTAQTSSGQAAGFADPATDHTSTNDNKIAGVVLGGNAAVDQHDPYYLTSKVLDTNKNGTVFLSFWRWLNTKGVAPIVDTVEVTTDGQIWTPIWTNTADVFDNAWVPQAFDVSLYKSSTFQFRFGHEVLASGAAVVSSWNIDDVAISSCPPM